MSPELAGSPGPAEDGGGGADIQQGGRPPVLRPLQSPDPHLGRPEDDGQDQVKTF